MASCTTLLPLTGVRTYTEMYTQNHSTCVFLLRSPSIPKFKNIRRETWRLCVKTLEKISKGGPLIKHLPMSRQRMHHY